MLGVVFWRALYKNCILHSHFGVVFTYTRVSIQSCVTSALTLAETT